MESQAPEIVALHKVSKTFGLVKALSSVSLRLHSGEMRGLIGPNGAGKSTLVKILSGAVRPDSGSVRLRGQVLETQEFKDPGSARRAGVVAVHQDLNLFEDMSVAENIVLGAEPSRRLDPIRLRSRNDERAKAQDLLDRLRVDISPNDRLGELAYGDRVFVQVCQAIAGGAVVLILDEPTAALGPREASRLFDLCRTLQAEGIGILFVSHRLREVCEQCQTVTALRDGRVVADASVQDLQENDLISLVAESGASSKREQTWVQTRRALRVEELEGERFAGLVLEAFAGEIVCLTGLLGSGAREAVKAIAGVEPARSGTVTLAGTTRGESKPTIGFIPENRRREGIIPELSLEENIGLALLAGGCALKSVNRRSLKQLAQHFIDRMGIRAPDTKIEIGKLSGGNQQKALIARWLAKSCDLLVLDEPLHGLDIGAKAEVRALLEEFASKGGCVVVHTADEQVAADLGDRTFVFAGGRVVKVFDQDATAGEILAAAGQPVESALSIPQDRSRAATKVIHTREMVK